MYGWGAWDASWIWSLALVAITMAIHAVGIVLIAAAIRRIGVNPVRQGIKYGDSATVATVIIVGVGLSLAVLHTIESVVWAIVYVWLGALPSPAEAALYSVDSMTTRGASGLFLAPQWRMMGAMEGGDGMLLFGISTAFLFYVMLHLWKDQSQNVK